MAREYSRASPAATLDALTDLKPGDVADGMKIEILWRNDRNRIWQLGYLDMKLSPEPQYDDAAHLISYRVTVMKDRNITWDR